MQSTARRSVVRRLVPGAAALSALVLVGTGVAVAVSGLPEATPPSGPVVTASLPDGLASLTPGDGHSPGPCGPAAGPVRTCNLVAAAGNVMLPGALPSDPPISVPIWSFTTAGTPTVPVGPTLIAFDSETVNINVVNSLPGFAGKLAIEVPGFPSGTADSNGVASGGTATWTGSNLPAGTYIYEAGQLGVGSATDNAARQDAMGLVGTLVVRPHDFDQTATTTPRYDLTGSSSVNGCSVTGASGFTAEALVQVTELSTEFNKDVGGGGSKGLAPYEPNYFLINGVPYTSTAPTIDVAQGDCLLLRYADLGQSEHSMGPVGVRQTVIAQDDRPMMANTPRNLDAEYLTPGQTADALVQVSPNAHIGNQIPVVDLGRFLHNDLSSTAATPSLGGAAIAINVVAETVAASALGPSSQVTVTPATDSGAIDLNGSVTFSSVPATATWYLDTVGGPISGSVTLTGTTGSFTVPAIPSFNTLLDGDHIVWVQATDGVNLGAPGGDVFTLNKTGPTIYALAVDPPVTNGTTRNKASGVLPPLVATSYSAGSGTLDFGLVNPGLIVGEPIQILGLSPANWNGNFTVASLSGNTVTFSFGPYDPAANADQTLLPANVVTGGAQQVSSDLLVNGTVEPSLVDWAISSLHWVIQGTGLVGDVTYFDPTSPVPPNNPPSLGSPVAVAIDIPAASVAGLSEGTYTINLTATESRYTTTTIAGPATQYTLAESRQNLAPVPVTFVVDKSGPTAAITSVTPDPAGELSNNSANMNYFPSVRVKATITDSSPIQQAELFLTAPTDPAPNTGASVWKNGGGTQLAPFQNTWGGALNGGVYSLDVYADVPVAEFTSYTQGFLRIWVHGQDAAGNWGTFTATPPRATGAGGVYDLQLDKTQPRILDATTTPVEPAPNVTGAALPSTFGTLHFWAQDPALPTPSPSGWAPFAGQIATVEWQLSSTGVINPATFTGTVVTTAVSPQAVPGDPVLISVDLSASPVPLAAGLKVVYRVRDAAGNYSGFYVTSLGV